MQTNRQIRGRAGISEFTGTRSFHNFINEYGSIINFFLRRKTAWFCSISGVSVGLAPSCYRLMDFSGLAALNAQRT